MLSRHNPPEVIATKTAAIYVAVLRESQHITQPNFQQISSDDLAHLFRLYDQHFFDGWLGQTVKAKADGPLVFRLSSRMTRAGGKTIKREQRGPAGDGYCFEIAIASRMLFMTFGDVQRPVTVCGLSCKDRLEALQRITEHEIIHLTELLAWGKSSCSARRFKKLAQNIFGHADTKHALVTAGEYAAVQYGVKVGGMVEFEFKGRRLVGRVNRVHRRATVLVKDGKGQRHSDGGRYARFYVPLGMLKPVPSQEGGRKR